MPSIGRENAEAPLILTIDVGSSSVRASLFDGRAFPIRDLEVKVPYQLDTTPDGGVEKDPDQVLKLIFQAVDGLLLQAGGLASKIAGVAIDTFWHGLLGIDHKNNALTPVITWADTRSSNAAAQLKHELNEKSIHNRTGCLLHASYFPAKLRWLATTQPKVFGKVARWLSIGEYLYLKLFGETRVSVSMASGTGLLDRGKCIWDTELLECLKTSPAQLSPIGDLDTPQIGLLPEFAKRWPVLAQVKWFLPVGDGASSNLGSGCFSPDRLALMVGTSGAMRVVCEAGEVEIPVPWGLWCYRADRKRYVMGGALSEGGNLFAWMRQTLQLPAVEEVETELAQMQPAAHGLTVLPFLSGERAPGYASQARATITGLSLNTNSLDILRAGLESIAYRFGLIYELLQPILPKSAEIVASGGALLHSPTWLQIISDVLDRPVIASGEQEASSRGAALMALEQLKAFGENRGLENAEYDFGRVYQPNAAHHARYHEAMAEQRVLYQDLVKSKV